MRFRIVGDGSFGQALAKIFAENMILEESLQNEFLPFEKNDILIPCVPSNVLMHVLNKLQFEKASAILLISKGIAMPELLTETIKKIYDIPLLYLIGPNLAKEIQHDVNFLSLTIAGPLEHTSKIKKFMKNIVVDEMEDIIMPQIVGCVKNITAFVVGYLNLSENARATMIMQGMKESVKLAKLLGSNEQNFLRACFSDFILTCTSENSRNYQAGKNFNHAQKSNETQESLLSIENVYALKNNVKMPIIDFAYQLIKHNSDARNQLMHDIHVFA